jgi:hypothetical protein
MTKHIEIKTYTYGDINITVAINFDKQHISLLEKDNGGPYGAGVDTRFKNKEYIFVKRGLEYMNGWRNVLTAMNYAIDEAEEELKDYIKMKEKEKHDLVTDVLMQATNIVKSKSEQRRIKELKKNK